MQLNGRFLKSVERAPVRQFLKARKLAFVLFFAE